MSNKTNLYDDDDDYDDNDMISTYIGIGCMSTVFGCVILAFCTLNVCFTIKDKGGLFKCIKYYFKSCFCKIDNLHVYEYDDYDDYDDFDSYYELYDKNNNNNNDIDIDKQIVRLLCETNVKYYSQLQKNDNICSICIENMDISNNNIIMLKKCKHLFHEDCIIPWYKINSICPLCRC